MDVCVNEMVRIVKDASKIFFDTTRKENVEEKGYGNYVTECDKAVQDCIMKAMKEVYPDIPFLAEEKDNDEIDSNGSFFVLDPIDGTMNFMHDLGRSAISLAYVLNGKLRAACVYDPYRDEVYTAKKNEGAYLNGKQIHVSKKDGLKEAMVFTGTVPYDKSYADYYFKCMKDTFMHCEGIRRSGSAVLELANVAAGRADGYFEHVQSWDRAAGMLLIEEAGGKVCSYDGSECPIVGFHDIVAGNKNVVDDLLVILQRNK